MSFVMVKNCKYTIVIMIKRDKSKDIIKIFNKKENIIINITINSKYQNSRLAQILFLLSNCNTLTFS